MAISLESANKVRQKTYGAGLNPLVYAQLKAFFQFWATHKSNADLQFIPFDGTDADAAGGKVLADAACTLYAVFLEKGNLGNETDGTATDAYIWLLDDATDDAGAGTDGRIALPSLTVDEQSLYLSPAGIVMATGVVVKAYTDIDGVTDSTAGDAPNGFVIIGQ